MPATLLLSWEKSFETGLELIDNQHKELIAIINIYNVQCSIVPNAAKAKHALEELRRVCETHFKHEELIQTSCQYPQFGTHQTAHSGLLFDLRRWTITMSGTTIPLSTLLECHDFIITAITSHLEIHDAPFFEYYREYCIKNNTPIK